MSKTFRIARQLAAFMFVILSLGSAGSIAYAAGCPDSVAFPLNGCSLPGLVDGSYPYFDNVVSISYKDKGDGAFDIRAKDYKGSVDNRLALDTDITQAFEKAKYDLKASVDGGAASGTLKISGTLVGGEFDGEKFTVTADLAGPYASSPDGTLWGFNTENIVCDEVINTLTGGCTSAEVVYLNLLEAIGPGAGFEKISTAGRALTSVPLPAAAWLFGTGLLALAGMARRWNN